MAVDFVSAFAVGSAANESVWDVSLDGAGNTCVVGRFTGTVDFDPAAGAYELTSSPAGVGNTFVAKYDPAGNLLWAQQFGGNLNNFGPEIAAGSDGSVYVVGSFTGLAQFGATTLTSAGSNDVYVVKLDADGSIAWAHGFGGVNDDHGNSVAVDGAGNAYVLAETTTAPSGGRDAFFAKIDASGMIQWTKAVGASNSLTAKGNTTLSTGWLRGFKLALDNSGDVYATGRVGGTVDFDPGPGKTALSGDGFVMKLTSAGDLGWARTFAGGYLEAHDIAVDGGGNVYSTGMYWGTVDFDPGKAKFNLNTGVDVNRSGISATYVSALNSSGNFLWAKSTQSVGGTSYGAIAHALALDAAGGVHLTGEFSGTADFDPGPDTFNLTSPGAGFVWNLDSSGNFVSAVPLGATGQGVGLDSVGNVYVAGSFAGTADFDPGAGAFNLTSAGGNDFFVAKLVQAAPLSLASTSSTTSLNTLLASAEGGASYAGADAGDTLARRLQICRTAVDAAFASLL